MDDTVRIKCPFCSAILKVKQSANLENASITCLVCKRKSAYTDYVSVKEISDEETQIPGKALEGGTIVPPQFAGDAYITERSGLRWKLHPGRNTVGRKLQSDPQQVDIPISDYSGERKMSRNHATIDAIPLPVGGCKYVLQNWKNLNPTKVDGTQLQECDRIVLHPGSVITLANIEVRFEMEKGSNDDCTVSS